MKPEIVKITDSASMEAILFQAVDLLKNQGVIVCATDTGYLLGVDALNPNAVKKIYQIKERSFNKPIHLVVADKPMAKRLAYLDYRAEKVFDHFLPGALTIILKRKLIVPDVLVSGLDTVGLRVPAKDFLLWLVHEAGTPMTATSANRSGNATPYTVDEVIKALGEAVEFVDLIVDEGATQHASTSTILDMTQQPAKILRQGPITLKMLGDYVK